jgi:hypothetical protein
MVRQFAQVVVGLVAMEALATYALVIKPLSVLLLDVQTTDV